MTEPVETPAAPPRCPRCDAPMAPEQDWCLECGAAVTTRVLPPPGWRLPVVVGLAVLGLLGLGVAIAVSAISGDADRAAGAGGARVAANAPASAARPASTPVRTTGPASPTTTTTSTAAVPGAAEATAGGAVPLWPARQQGYTVVVPSAGGRPGAVRGARRQIAGGARAGILRTDGYDFFSPGSWVVWVGRYPDRPAAQAHLDEVQRNAPDAYVTLIRPRGRG